MIAFVNYWKLSAVATIALAVLAEGAQQPAPRHIDIKEMSQKVEDVVVPLPNEIFGALKARLEETFLNSAIFQTARSYVTPSDRST